MDLAKNQINLKVARGNFKDKTSFCTGADSVVKMYSNKIYAVDSTGMQLHIFDQILCLWSSNSLEHYRVPS